MSSKLSKPPTSRSSAKHKSEQSSATSATSASSASASSCDCRCPCACQHQLTSSPSSSAASSSSSSSSSPSTAAYTVRTCSVCNNRHSKPKRNAQPSRHTSVKGTSVTTTKSKSKSKSKSPDDHFTDADLPYLANEVNASAEQSCDCSKSITASPNPSEEYVHVSRSHQPSAVPSRPRSAGSRSMGAVHALKSGTVTKSARSGGTPGTSVKPSNAYGPGSAATATGSRAYGSAASNKEPSAGYGSGGGGGGGSGDIYGVKSGTNGQSGGGSGGGGSGGGGSGSGGGGSGSGDGYGGGDEELGGETEDDMMDGDGGDSGGDSGGGSGGSGGSGGVSRGVSSGKSSCKECGCRSRKSERVCVPKQRRCGRMMYVYMNCCKSCKRRC